MGTKYKKNEARGEWITYVWDGTYDADGKKHRKWLTSKKSSADLERQVAEFKRLVEKRGFIDEDNVLFGDYAMRWLTISKATRELNTQKMYENVIRKHFDLIYDLPLTSIRHSHFQQIINEQSSHPRTCQQIALTFRQIIKSAVRDRYLPRTALYDILEDISLPTYKKPQKRPLTDLEKEAFFRADLDPKKRAFLNILYYTGLRRGEALALTTEDLDFDQNTLTVSKVIIYDVNDPKLKPYPKSENGKRIIPIPEDCRAQLKEYCESIPNGSYLFTSSGSPIMTKSAYDRMWESILCSLNMALGYDPQAKKGEAKEKKITSLTAHVFRHNYCTELCYQIPAISTKMIAKLLGDNERMVIDVYGHLQEEREDLSGALSRAFKRDP